MIIGNTNNANIKYNSPYLGQNEIKIYKNETGIVLEQSQAVSYKNDILIKETKATIQNGDTINIFGLKLIFLNNIILMNNHGGKIQIAMCSFDYQRHDSS